MADNVTLPGTGAVVASDDVSGVQYQVMKIALGGDGAATLLPGEGTYGVDVDVTRLPALAAGTNVIGAVSAGQDTASIYSGTTALTPKFAAIAASSSGNNTIVAAVSNKKIRVLSMTLSASAAVNGKFQSAAGGTDLTGLFYFAANGGMVLPHNPQGWFETAASALLNLNLSGAVAVGGCLTYIEV